MTLSEEGERRLERRHFPHKLPAWEGEKTNYTAVSHTRFHRSSSARIINSGLFFTSASARVSSLPFLS